MKADSSIVQEVRDRAMRISEAFGHDPRRYVDHLLRMQEDPALRERVVGQITVEPLAPGEPKTTSAS